MLGKRKGQGGASEGRGREERGGERASERDGEQGRARGERARSERGRASDLQGNLEAASGVSVRQRPLDLFGASKGTAPLVHRHIRIYDTNMTSRKSHLVCSEQFPKMKVSQDTSEYVTKGSLT